MTDHSQKDSAAVGQALTSLVERQLPRWLSQACRDPNDPAYGCFDRNWWHYRMRDFPSIILQQGGYAVWEAAQVCPSVVSTGYATALARASCLFWNMRSQRWRAFEEYYPWEQGYPPLAFSTLAVVKLIDRDVVSLEEMLPGLRIAARQLARRFEARAANQQVAGMAALVWIRKLAPELVSGHKAEQVVSKTLALQTKEGWFWEYDGPDTGYLSVALDCLWDAWDATRDQRLLSSAKLALQFIHTCVARLQASPGMLNSRNTDYIVPYGLTRFVVENYEQEKDLAAEVLHHLFSNLHSPQHFLNAVDDRYWCHYIGHSVARAAILLRDFTYSNPGSRISDNESCFLPECGYLFESKPNGLALCVALSKGGSFTLRKDFETYASDFGWIIHHNGSQSVTHWWSLDWQFEKGYVPFAKLQGKVIPTKPLVSTPWMHVGLRAASLLVGDSLIGTLKNAMIFKRAKGDIVFKRSFEWDGDKLIVHDKISGLPSGAIVSRAPRASKRHVASADSYHLEDGALERGFQHTVRTSRSTDTFTAAQTWHL